MSTPDPFPFQIGSLLATRYRIDAKIGEGGMGAVFRAFDSRNLDRMVAIKVINAKFIEKFGPKAKQRMEREKEAYLRITHPNIVQIIDSGETEDGSLFLVQEYIAGDPLDKVLKQRQTLPLQEVLSIVNQIGAALEAIHSEGIIHRDLKPSNIMLQTLSGGTRQVKIIDFGIARIENSVINSALTADGSSIGTPWYSSPEQLQGAQPSPMMDLWALAVVAYQMLAGAAPFREPTILAIERKQRNGATPVRKLRPDLPEKVETVISKALSYEPSDRYQTPRAFCTALSLAFSSSGKNPAVRPNVVLAQPVAVVEAKSPASAEAKPARLDRAETAKFSGAQAVLPEDPEMTLDPSGQPPNVNAKEAAPRPPGMPLLESATTAPNRIVLNPEQLQVQVVLPSATFSPMRWLAGAALILVLVVGGLWGLQYLNQSPLSNPVVQNPPTPPPVTPAVLLTLRYRLRVDDGKGKPFYSSGREVYRSGNKFKFFAQPSTEGHLYILNESPNGQVILLFPARHLRRGASKVLAQEEISLPKMWFKFDNVVGSDRFVVIQSKGPVEFFEALPRSRAEQETVVLTDSEKATYQSWRKTHPAQVSVENLDYETYLKSTQDPLIGVIELSHR
ncbi:MAG: protein kinase [Blastocatellia bacterium]|nr:protein kinase [Blastocatellia bacterium]